MDKITLQSFLHPKRKNNLIIKLPDFDPPFEMRQLSAGEDLELSNRAMAEGITGSALLMRYIAASLVVPNLRDKELLDALSEREGRKILDPVEALKCICNSPDLTALVKAYNDYNDLITDFQEKVEETKN